MRLTGEGERRTNDDGNSFASVRRRRHSFLAMINRATNSLSGLTSLYRPCW